MMGPKATMESSEVRIEVAVTVGVSTTGATVTSMVYDVLRPRPSLTLKPKLSVPL
jgi:hypothetical protein